MISSKLLRVARLSALTVCASLAQAAPLPSPSLFGVSSGNAGGNSLSVPMQIVFLLTLLTLLPAVVMSITPFLRIVVVLHFLRQALGTQSTPSNQVLIGLSLFLTILIMNPVAAEIYHKGWEPMEKKQLSYEQAFDEGSKPLKAFLVRFAREKDISLFLDVTHAPAPRTPGDLDLKVLIPAYILSELKAGFQIGAVLFLPFLVIDLVVASDQASFATPGVKIGLFCTTPMVALTRAIGPKRAFEMLVTGEVVDAKTAAEWGLVNRVVPTPELAAETRKLAARIAEASSLVMAIGKQAYYTQIDLDRAKAYAYAKEVMSMNALAADAQEGISAFLGKRRPCWSGR